jgi:hypothetical protein
MENPINRVAEHQRRALDFMVDGLGLRHAHDEAVRRDRVFELETAVIALRAQNCDLRAEIRGSERYPEDVTEPRASRAIWMRPARWSRREEVCRREEVLTSIESGATLAALASPSPLEVLPCGFGP